MISNLLLKKNFAKHPFHIVTPSPWPFILAVHVFMLLYYIVLMFHEYWFCLWGMYFNLIVFVGCIISWFYDIVLEATFEGQHTKFVRAGLRLGFLMFIVSEVMFFFSFFWAFFHCSVSPSIWVGAVWPPFGVKVIQPFAIPFLNTLLLLSSGVTVTWAHKAICGHLRDYRRNYRQEVTAALFFTICLGVVFTLLQLYEYVNAPFSINDSIYGAVFYLATGFHGFHVLVGTIFLIACLIRHVYYHFTRTQHLGLELAIWYWHFVDVVWIFLFICIYWLGS